MNGVTDVTKNRGTTRTEGTSSNQSKPELYREIAVCFGLTIAICLLAGPAFTTAPSAASQIGNMTATSTEVIDYSGMSSANVAKLVSIFAQQKLPEITVRLNAYGEFRNGQPSSATVATAKQIITEAAKYGIKVNVDIHTWYTTWDTYFRDAAANCTAYRAKYIMYLRNSIAAFSGYSVAAWMVLNEPQARKATASENQFILDIISAAKNATSKPVSVRFMGGYSPDTGYYSTSIDVACDFLSRNVYWDARKPTQTVYGVSSSVMSNMINNARSKGKQLWVTEFGKSKSNVTDQADYVKAFVDYANNAGINKIFAWVSKPLSGASETYNIFGDNLAPYPAFYELKNADQTTQTEPTTFTTADQTTNSTTQATTTAPPVTETNTTVADATTNATMGQTNTTTTTQPTTIPANTTTPTKTTTEAPNSTTTQPTTTTEPAQSTLILGDDFESHNLGQWTGTVITSGESASTTSSLPRSGSYSCVFTSDGRGTPQNAYIYKAVNESEIYVRGYFYIGRGLPLKDSGDRLYFISLRANGHFLACAGIRRDGKTDRWMVYAGNGANLVGPSYASTSTIMGGRWYCVELHWKRDSSQGLVELYVNGQRVIVLTGLNTGCFGNVSEVDLGIISATKVQNRLTIYGDSFIASREYIDLKLKS